MYILSIIDKIFHPSFDLMYLKYTRFIHIRSLYFVLLLTIRMLNGFESVLRWFESPLNSICPSSPQEGLREMNFSTYTQADSPI